MAWLVRAALLGCLLLAGQARATVFIQPIDVCASDGSNCALETGVPGSYDPAAIQKTFAQAGVTVNVLNPVQYDNSAFLNPQVLDDPAQGYNTGSPTDAAHLLLNTPGHGQNANPNVINLFLVDTLPHATATASGNVPASLLFGLSLQDGNGSIATTHVQTAADGTNYVSGVDNIPHEIGHALGLTHVDGTPIDSVENLMRGTGRDVATDTCQITPTTCGGPNKDVLVASQVATVQSTSQNLFTVGLASATASFSQTNGECGAVSVACGITVSVPPESTGQSLVGVKVRYLHAQADQVGTESSLVFYTDPCTRALLTPSGANVALPGGGFEQDYTFPAGCLVAGGNFGFLDVGLDANGLPITLDLTPFSFEFDFSGGVTSRAAFDSSGNGVFTASSDSPVELGNALLPQQPGVPVPTDPATFNAQSVPEDDGGTPVPEPAGAALLAGAAALLAAARRWRPGLR